MYMQVERTKCGILTMGMNQIYVSDAGNKITDGIL